MLEKILAGLFFIALFGLAFAVPGVPHAFYGDVTINGAPAPDGTTVSARINNAEVKAGITSNGRYGYSPNVFHVEDQNSNNAGKTIQFFVNGINANKDVSFCNACFNACGTDTNNCAKHNLDVTIASPPSGSPPSSGSSGGGGGGSSGGGSSGATTATTSNLTNTSSTGPSTSEPSTTQACTENWICSDWSACSDGIQTRSCQDSNNCGTDVSKPLESQPCSTVSPSQPGQPGQTSRPSYDFISAFATASPTALGAVVVAIIVVLYIIWRIYKKKSKKSKQP